MLLGALAFPFCQKKIRLGVILVVYVVTSTHPGIITLSLYLAQIFTYSELRVQNLMYDFEECCRQKNFSQELWKRFRGRTRTSVETRPWRQLPASSNLTVF